MNMDPALISIIVFLAVYATIAFDLINKAVATFSGVSILVLLNIISTQTLDSSITKNSYLPQAIMLIDYETIMLLFGMMVIINVLKKSGFFVLIAIYIAELTRGKPIKILILFSFVTGAMSAFLDNITTILIIIPLIIELTKGLGLNPKKYILSQVIISNIGGAATLIGGSQNIIIGSKAGLSFNQFVLNMGPPTIIIFFVILIFIWLINKNEYKSIDKNILQLFTINLLLKKIQHNFINTNINKPIIIKSIILLAITFILFITQSITHLTPGAIALSMGIFLVLYTNSNIENILEDIDWSSLMFFVGLFILVGTLEHYQVIDWIANNIFNNLGENPYINVLIIQWASGLISGFIDNTPFTITMIPIIDILNNSNPILQNLLWWSLALGTSLGSNITILGASANIISIGIAKKAGINISFLDFMKLGAIISFISLLISSIYLIFRVSILL